MVVLVNIFRELVINFVDVVIILLMNFIKKSRVLIFNNSLSILVCFIGLGLLGILFEESCVLLSFVLKFSFLSLVVICWIFLLWKIFSFWLGRLKVRFLIVLIFVRVIWIICFLVE